MPRYSRPLLADLRALAAIVAVCASVMCGVLWAGHAGEALAASGPTAQLAGGEIGPRFF